MIKIISSSSVRRSLARSFPYSTRRDCLVLLCCLAQKLSGACLLTSTYYTESFSYAICMQHSSYSVARHIEAPLGLSLLEHSVARRSKIFESESCFERWTPARCMSNAPIELKTENDVIRFSVGKPIDTNCSSSKEKKMAKRVKMSRKAKVNALRLYRLKAKKKMNSPNPEVRIRYKLEKAKRKETWLIEKLRKFEVPKAPKEAYDPEILTEEEKHYLKRTGEKKKNYVQVGRRGVFGGVVLNMHMHWKNHETVKVICKPCKPGEVHEYAEELARLSKGIVIDIKPGNVIIFYRGKNYVQPKVMSPPDTLSKDKALEKYKYMQSLEHTSHFIEKLEKELEEYHKHLARFKKVKEDASRDATINA